MVFDPRPLPPAEREKITEFMKKHPEAHSPVMISYEETKLVHFKLVNTTY